MTDTDPRLSRLYRENSTEGPPAALDAGILAAARRRVAKPQAHARSSWGRWMAPVSAIATLVLGVSIALLVEREQPETTRDVSVHPIRPQPQSPPPLPVPEPAKAKTAERAAPGASTKMDAPSTAKEEATAADAPMAAPGATLPVPVPAPAARLRPQEAAAPVQAPAPGPADAAPSTVQAFQAEGRNAMTESNTSAPTAATGARSAGDSALGAAGLAAGKAAPQRIQPMQRSAEVWLDLIRRLKSEGRDKEAAEQLAEFRKVYPNYAVPQTLLK